MRTLTRKERLSGRIGIALMAGMFSMVPVTYGMPVVAGNLDANSQTMAVPVPVAGTGTLLRFKWTSMDLFSVT